MRIFKISKLLILIISICLIKSLAQNPVQLGKGSYAEYVPLYEAANPYIEGPDGWGDKSQHMLSRPIYVVDTNTRAIPTNDWWTNLIFDQYAGNMFAHPLMVKAQNNGIYIEYPTQWNFDGTSVESNSAITLIGENFTAADAKARRWGDWTVDFIMQDEQKSSEMAVTLAHGIPFVWTELSNLNAELKFSGTPTFFDNNGSIISLPYTNSYVGVEVNGDNYGIFLPNLATIKYEESSYKLAFNNSDKFVVIGALPSKTNLELFSNYAYAIPRDSKVSWTYNEEKSIIKTNWELTTENLKGEENLQVIQGFIPHHYRKSTVGFNFENFEYLTARGTMKCAIGNDFEISFPFNGLLPYMPAPEFKKDDLFSESRLKQMVKNYTGKSGYGGDTYWGGKDVLYYSQYMTFAEQLGDTESFNIFKNKLTDALTDWYTFSPGEQEHYFAYHERWKTMLGLNASYGSDEFNDLHFHYGYFAYATGILSFFDKQFAEDYGSMAKHVVKQYANWQRDNNAPFLRTFDIWEGHSWAGGVGDAWNGNGQESSSEAMQGWGGMFTLATALSDNEMRDAAIFGYTMEALGTEEYWFDRSKENIDYTKYTRPYNSNITGRGIGWWTWFSGDPVWMHSIQWLPISTSLKYLYEDTEYARWDYEQMWNSKEISGWNADLGNDSGLGNVLLSYMQIFDADSTAKLLNWLWDNNKPVIHDNYTGGITYYFTHAHRYLGNIQWNIHTNIPSSTVYINANNDTAVVVFNNSESDIECVVYNESHEPLVKFNAPSNKLIVHKLDASIAKIILSASSKTVQPNKRMQINAFAIDQYGAKIDANLNWSVSGNATISNSGEFEASEKGKYMVTANSENIEASITIRVDDEPVLAKLEANSNKSYMHIGQSMQFIYQGFDQYNDEFETEVTWSVSGGGTIDNNGLLKATAVKNNVIVTATSGNISASNTIDIRLPLSNVAFLKNVEVSSQENVGTPGSYINDGDLSTRWSSEFIDPQYVLIDLEKTYNISAINLYWEASYGKAYEIYITNNESWENENPAFTQNNSSGGLDIVNIEAAGRFVILKGLQRSSQYGYSLFEIEVYGTPLAEGTSTLSAINITPEWVSIKDSEIQQYSATGIDQYGENIDFTPHWSVLGDGSFNQSGLFTPSGSGIMKIVASQDNVSANAEIYVEETPKISAINITIESSSENRYPIIQGVANTFTVEGFDQFGGSTNAQAIWSISGGGTIDQNGQFSATEVGDFLIFATYENLIDTAFISIKKISEVDVAQGKPTKASSSENSGSASDFAVDGNSETRWSSEWEDPQWFMVDLENIYDIYKIRINWEGAFGKSYDIQFSKNGIDWTTVYSETNSDGGEDIIELTGEAKYIRFYGTERATGYGYSFFDFEVYATGIITETPVLTTISITPYEFELAPNESVQFSAICLDQFGNIFEANPIWSTNESNTIDNTGLFVAGSQEGSFEVKATVDTIIGFASIQISETSQITNIEITPADTTIEAGESIQFSAKAFNNNNQSINTSFSWNASGGGIIDDNGIFTSDSTIGNFTITTHAGTKTQSAVITVINSKPSSFIENSTKTSINVWPNPAQDLVNIQLNNNRNIYQMRIIGLDGKIYHSLKTLNTQLEISTYNWPNGFYIIEIKQSNKISYSKFMIINNLDPM